MQALSGNESFPFRLQHSDFSPDSLNPAQLTGPGSGRNSGGPGGGKAEAQKERILGNFETLDMKAQPGQPISLFETS